MKVVQVGMGGMGNAWIRAVQKSTEIEFAGFVEISDDIATQQINAYGLDGTTVYKTLEEAIRNLKVDGIINVTPPQFHREVSVIAMEAGIPVLSEKPLAGTLEDSRAIVDTANKTGILHMVAQNYRYTPLAQTAKAVLDSGDLGDIGAITISFFKGPHFGGFREEMSHPLIIDMSIHHFDMMRFFLDSNPKEIYARSWNPSWSWYKGDACVALNALFENGITAVYSGSWCAQGMETSWNANWRFDCEKGILSIEDDAVYIQHLTGLKDLGGYKQTITDEKSLVPLVSMPLQAQDYLLHEFYEAISMGKTPKTTAQDNIYTIQFVFNTVLACDSGNIIRS